MDTLNDGFGRTGLEVEAEVAIEVWEKMLAHPVKTDTVVSVGPIFFDGRGPVK